MEFKTGDKVRIISKFEVFGTIGDDIVVIENNVMGHKLYLANNQVELIDRPKKKVKKWKVVYYKDGLGNGFPLVSVDYYKDEKEFMSLTKYSRFISFVKELEIEVEE